MLGGVNNLSLILFGSGSASDKEMLKIVVPAILLLLMVGVWVRATESGFVNYYRGDFELALTDLRQKGDEGDAHAAYLVGQIYAGGKAGAPNSDLALEWYVKAASHGSIAAPFSYLDHQLVSTYRPPGFCADFREVVRQSARVKSIYAYLFLSRYHSSGVCGSPNILKSSYYMHLATSLDRAFGYNRDNLSGQLSEVQRQQLEKLLQQKVIPISQHRFLKLFAKTIRR